MSKSAPQKLHGWEVGLDNADGEALDSYGTIAVELKELELSHKAGEDLGGDDGSDKKIGLWIDEGWRESGRRRSLTCALSGSTDW